MHTVYTEYNKPPASCRSTGNDAHSVKLVSVVSQRTNKPKR